jgi:nitrate reductase gamma subunit
MKKYRKRRFLCLTCLIVLGLCGVFVLHRVVEASQISAATTRDDSKAVMAISAAVVVLLIGVLLLLRKIIHTGLHKREILR